MSLFTQTLPPSTAHLVEQLRHVSELQKFYLSGGTALSLQLGHRESQDLDFFSSSDFEPDVIQRALLSIGELENVWIEKGTLNAFLGGVKLQFLH